MQNIVVNMCENFHYGPLRNDIAYQIENLIRRRRRRRRRNNNNKNNVRSAWRPVSGSNNY